MMEVKTIQYLPGHISSIEEYRQICEAYDAELKNIWDALGLQLKNLDMEQMDSDTCDRWASLLGITFLPDGTLADKRRIIRGKMASGLPYTEPKIKEVIASMVGEDFYVWDLDRQGKKLRVGILLAEVLNVGAVQEIVRAMAPADVIVDVYIYYNRWLRFKTETWNTLWNNGADTWNDVKANAKWQEE